jgi:hypothetical protein
MSDELIEKREIDSADPIYTPSQLHDAATPLLQANLPFLVTGQPGQGKTDIVTQICEELGYKLQITHPVVDEPIDYKGFPFPYTDEDGKPKAAFIPFGHMEELINTKEPLVSFADDAGHAPKAVQAAYMQWILNRAINGQAMSPHVRFCAATNRREDKAGVVGFLEPLKDRFVTIMELISSLDDWCDWAVRHKLPYEVISYVRYCPDILDEWKPTPDFSRLPTPRSIYGVARMLKAGIPESLQLKMIAGAIGKERATGFVSFLNIYQNLVDPNAIINDPMGPDIPEDPGHIYALCGALAARATKKTIGNIIKFANRFADPKEFSDGMAMDEFSVFLVRDAVGQDRINLSKCDEFNNWIDKHQDVII